MVKRQRRMVDTAIFLGPLVLTLAVALLPPSNFQTFRSLVFLGCGGFAGGGYTLKDSSLHHGFHLELSMALKGLMISLISMAGTKMREIPDSHRP